VMLGTLMAPYTCCCAGLNLPRANCCGEPFHEAPALPLPELRECCSHCCDTAPTLPSGVSEPEAPRAPKEKCPRCADRFIPKLIVPSTAPAIELESVLLEIIPIANLTSSMLDYLASVGQADQRDPGSEVRYRQIVCHHVMRC
jgi:hypothetical protein